LNLRSSGSITTLKKFSNDFFTVVSFFTNVLDFLRFLTARIINESWRDILFHIWQIITLNWPTAYRTTLNNKKIVVISVEVIAAASEPARAHISRKSTTMVDPTALFEGYSSLF